MKYILITLTALCSPAPIITLSGPCGERAIELQPGKAFKVVPGEYCLTYDADGLLLNGQPVQSGETVKLLENTNVQCNE